MSTIINTDLGKNLDWRAYRHGYNEIRFLFTQNNAPFDLTDYDFSMVFRKQGDITEVLELEEEGGITNGGATGVLTVVLTADNIDEYLKRDMYFFELRYTKDDKPFRLTQGYLNLQREKNQASYTYEVPMPITDSAGQVVNVQILAFGSEFDISSLTESQLQQLWQALAPYSLGL